MESSTPQLLTIPLRFRVWDRIGQKFLSKRLPDGLSIEFSIFEMPLEIDCLEEDEKTQFIISQDTGLKDKDGRSIYTGDIVKLTKAKYDKIDRVNHTEEFTLPVVYERGEVALKVEREDCYGGDYWVLLSMQRPSDLQVLGNIWENLESLELKCCE